MSNDTITDIPSDEKISTPAEHFRVAYLSIAVAGIPGNILAICVLMSAKSLREKNVNIFIIHQSFVDLMVCIIEMLSRVIPNVYYGGIFQDFLCRFWLSYVLRTGVAHASGYNLMFLTLERYWAVTKPLAYDEARVRKRLPYIFCSVWVIGIVSMFPKFSTARMIGGRCVPYYDIHKPILFSLMTPWYYTIACIIPGNEIQVHIIAENRKYDLDHYSYL